MNNDENLSGTSSPETEAQNETEHRADVDFNELKAEEASSQTLGDVNDFSAVYNVPVQISAVLGRAVMPVSQLLKLGRGAVVELDRRVGESVDIYVNNRLVARGEVVIVDERLGITMTEIIKSER